MVLTAKEWGWSPTAIIRDAKDPHKPHWADYNFATAVRILTEEKCPQCGVPVWYGMSTDSAIAFKSKTIVCYGCQHQEQNAPKEKRPGESQVVYPVPADGFEELPTRINHFEREHRRHVLEAQKEAERRAKLDTDE